MLICLAMTPVVAHATSTPALAVSLLPVTAKGKPTRGPAYFIVRRAAGHTAHMHALLTYHGAGHATVALVPVDAGTSATGAITYNLPGAPRRQTAAWVHLTRPRIRLAAGKSAMIDFTVSVPRDAKPGQYLGALTVFIPVAGAGTGNIGVLRIQPRLAVAILVTVPAPAHA